MDEGVNGQLLHPLKLGQASIINSQKVDGSSAHNLEVFGPSFKKPRYLNVSSDILESENGLLSTARNLVGENGRTPKKYIKEPPQDSIPDRQDDSPRTKQAAGVTDNTSETSSYKTRNLKPLLECSDDSEEELQEPIFNFDRSQPSDKRGCWTRLCDFLKNRWLNTFFMHYRDYFNDNYLKSLNTELPLPMDWQPRYHVFTFKDCHDRIDRKKALKMFGGDIAAAEHYFQSVKYDIDRQYPLMAIMLDAARHDLIWSTFFRVLRHTATITIPFVMKAYLESVSKFERVDIIYSILYCLAASQLSFWAALWGKISQKYFMLARARANEKIRHAVFIKILDANIEFSSKAGSALVTKLLFYDLPAFAGIFPAIVSMIAAPISITYGFVMMFISFRTNSFVFFILGYAFAMLVVIFFLYRWMVILMNKYRSIASRCASYIEDIINKNKYVKSNTLEGFLLRKIWNCRRELNRLIKSLNFVDSVFDVIFSSPILISALVMFSSLQEKRGNVLDSKTLYTIIGALNSLRSILLSLSDCVIATQNFLQSHEIVDILFNKVSRTPKVSLLKLDSRTLPNQDFIVQSAREQNQPEHFTMVIQHSKKVDSREAIAEALQLEMNFAVRYDECTFVDKSNAMSDVLKTIFMEQFLVHSEKRVVENTKILKNLSLRIRPGQKVCIVGKDDKGYQRFMNTLSNELELVEGKLYIRGKVNHFDLNRFELLDESFLENIVLDSTYRRKKLEKICQYLDLDFKKFSGRELGRVQTNPNLTFFDRVKILLARALYQNFDIFVISNLFQDLSSESRRWFFERVVLYYLKFTTVLYHSNDVALIKKADYVLVFKDYNLVERGTYDELNAKENSVFKQITNQMAKIEQTTHITKFGLDARRLKRRNAIFESTPAIINLVKKYHRGKIFSSFVRIAICYICMKRRIKRFIANKQAKSESRKFTGSTSLSQNFVTTYLKLLRINGRHTIYVVLLVYFLDVALKLFWDVWLGWWSSDFLKIDDYKIYFKILIGLSVVSGLYVLFADAIYNRMTRSISTNVFLANVKKLFKAEDRWYSVFGKQAILYAMFNYQNTLDDNFNRVVKQICSCSFTVVTSLIISNIFYPGIFFVITVLVVWYAYHITRKIIRTVRISEEGIYKYKTEWYKAYLSAQLNAVSMRHLGKNRYLYKRFEEVCIVIENSCLGWLYAIRYISGFIALINGFLVFWVYLCPVVFTYWHVFDFKHNLWLLGLVLTWSGMASTNVATLMDNIIGYQDVAEESERILELQRPFPITIVNPYYKDMKTTRNELTDEDLESIFIHKSNFSQITFDRSEGRPIVQFSNVSLRCRTFYYLHQVSLDIFAGDKIVLIDDNCTTKTFVKNLILGFQNPDSFTNSPESLDKPDIKVFGRDLWSINKYHMRLRMMYLSIKPFLFIGTLRDNIDPFRIYPDDEIIRLLHYFGFYNAFVQLLDKRSELEVANLLSDVNFDVVGDNLRQFLWGFGARKSNKRSLINKAIQQVKKRKYGQLPPVVYFSTPDIASLKFLRRLRTKVKIIISLFGLLRDVRDRERRLKEDLDLYRDVKHKGFTSFKRNQEDHSLELTEFVRPFKSIYQEFHDLDDLDSSKSYRMKKEASTFKLLKYRIQKSNEKEVLQKLLNSWISTDSKNLSFNMKKIIHLTRVMLRRPDILVLDEDALILDDPNDDQYLNSVFAVLRDTTIICSMRNFRIIQYFDKCATFCGPRLVEYDKVKKLMADPYSYTSALISKSDTRKVSLSIAKRRKSSNANSSFC